MKLLKKLNKSLKKKLSIRINLFHPKNDYKDCIVLKVEQKYIIVADFKDFLFYGISIIPKSNIKSIRDNKYEKCENKIIRNNKEIKKAKLPKYLKNFSNITKTMKILKKLAIWPSIESINPNKNNSSAYFIGPITKIKKNSLKIYCYDAKGKWENIYKIKYSNISNITVTGKYEKSFNTYMKNK